MSLDLHSNDVARDEASKVFARLQKVENKKPTTVSGISWNRFLDWFVGLLESSRSRPEPKLAAAVPPMVPPSPPNPPPGGGGAGRAGPSRWSRLLDWFVNMIVGEVTFNKIIAVGILFIVAWNVIHPADPDKAAVDKSYWDYKKSQVQNNANMSPPQQPRDVPGLQQQQGTQPAVHQAVFVPQQHTCSRVFEPKNGDTLLVNTKGACLTVPVTQDLFGVGTASPIISVSGADFTIIDDDLQKCESSTTSDRCSSWIHDHQKLGHADSRLNIPRYWMSYSSQGEITINTAQ